MQNEQNNTVTVIFKSKVDIEFDGEKFDFDENKKYEISKNKLESLPIDILAKLTVESFWANIRFVSQIKIEEMNKIKQGNRYYFSRYNNNLANCVIQLVKKHTDAAFEYLIAKRRLTEEKNIYFTPEEQKWFKDPMIVGKESLQLLYPEQANYFDTLDSHADALKEVIDEKLMLNTEYDKKLKYGNVLRYKEQSDQIDKIKKVKEEELYTELLKINKQYINYFDLDFLYRKIVIEKPNNGELNIFQKSFIDVCGTPEAWDFSYNQLADVFDRFAVLHPLQTLQKGWKLCKFICQQKIKDCIDKFESEKEIDEYSFLNFIQGIDAVNSFLSYIPEKQISKIIFPKNNNLDDMIEKIINIVQDKKFREYAEYADINHSLRQFAKLIVNNSNKEISSRVIAIDPCVIEDLSPDFIFNNLDNEVVWNTFCQNFHCVSEKVVNFCFDINNKLIPKYKEKFKKMLAACPALINNCNLDFIFDNLDNEIVWYAFCNGYDRYNNGKLFDYCIDKDKKVVQERKEKLFKLIKARPDLLIKVDPDKNKDKNYEFLYPLISKLILEKNRSLLQVFKSMNYAQYTAFWTDYFNWLKKNLETNTEIQIEPKDINTESNGNLFEINTQANQNEQNKNNEPIIDIEEEKSLISKNNFKKIIECERFINQKYRIYQENYWDSSENDLVWRILLEEQEEQWEFMWKKKTKLFQTEISQAKYLQSHQDLSRDVREEVKHVFDYIRDIETGYININRRPYVSMVKKMEEYDPNYPGLSELKSYSLYLAIIHWLIHIAIIILSIAIVAIPWIFLGWGLWLSYITVPACYIPCLFCWENLRTQDYCFAAKIFGLENKLREYANRRGKYRTVTDLFEGFIDSELCSVGDKAWSQVKIHFRDNAPDLENKIKKYSGIIKDFKDIKLNDVKRFIRRNHNTFMDKINNFFDDALTDKIKDMTINEIENKFRNYVNQSDNALSVACEKFINKNIVGHLNNIKEMLKIKGRRAYFRHKPNTNEQLMQDISRDLSELLWETLKKEHEKDKNIQENHLNTDKKNESVNDNKPITEKKEEEEINTSSKQ